MLKELMTDNNFWFVAIHAFLVGIALTTAVCYQIIKGLKKDLISQANAYDELLQGMQLEAPAKRTDTRKPLHVIRLENEKESLSGLAV